MKSYTINYHSDLTCLLLGLQGHAQGDHGVPAVPARAFSPEQAMAVAPGQIHSSCLVESLVSGAGGVQEGSHESCTSGMAGRNLASMASQPSLQVCLSCHEPLRLQLLWSVTWDLLCGFLMWDMALQEVLSSYPVWASFHTALVLSLHRCHVL